MKFCSFLSGLTLLIFAGAILIVSVAADQGHFTRFPDTDTSPSIAPEYPDIIPPGAIISVQATKGTTFRNLTANAMFGQGIMQAKPITAPGFRDTTSLMTPLKPSTGSSLTIPAPTSITPLTPSLPPKIPVRWTGTPLLKTGFFTTGSSSLPKIPFPPLTPVQPQSDVSNAPVYVSDATHAIEERIFYYTNQERMKAGKPAYLVDSRLSEIARDDAVDMATRGFFDHINPDGESPTDRAKRHGYQTEKDFGSYYRVGVGENIAMVQHIQGTPDDIARFIVDAWMNSPDHRENILDLSGAGYTNLGVGVAYDPVNDKYLAVQEFF